MSLPPVPPGYPSYGLSDAYHTRALLLVCLCACMADTQTCLRLVQAQVTSVLVPDCTLPRTYDNSSLCCRPQGAPPDAPHNCYRQRRTNTAKLLVYERVNYATLQPIFDAPGVLPAKSCSGDCVPIKEMFPWESSAAVNSVAGGALLLLCTLVM